MISNSKRRTERECQDFIHAVSHDLQEPLAKVITISELLLETSKNLDETEKDYLRRMFEAGRRMKKLIEDLANSHLEQ